MGGGENASKKLFSWDTKFKHGDLGEERSGPKKKIKEGGKNYVGDKKHHP